MKRREFIRGSAIAGMSLSVPLFLRSASGMFESPAGRKVLKVLNTEKTLVGTLPILRAFAGDNQDYVSPYVLFDEFGPVQMAAKSKPLRVDAHPHAGMVPTTYFLSGNGHHKDSLNYDFQIGKGDFMMFSSGRGAIHMEETGQKLYEDGGLYHGFQIWLNLPAKYKFTAPATFVHKTDKTASIEAKNYNARIILGEWGGAKSKIELYSPAFYFHIKMKSGCHLEIPAQANHNAFVYVINGQVEAEGRHLVKNKQLALYERGNSIIRLYSENDAEILALGGQPLNEPVYAYGPFVMNTEEQINQCIRNYNAGKMGDPALVNAR